MLGQQLRNKAIGRKVNNSSVQSNHHNKIIISTVQDENELFSCNMTSASNYTHTHTHTDSFLTFLTTEQNLYLNNAFQFANSNKNEHVWYRGWRLWLHFDICLVLLKNASISTIGKNTLSDLCIFHFIIGFFHCAFTLITQ